jgi:BlaR1 peptidase M56
MYFLFVILITISVPFLNLTDFINQHQEITKNEIVQQLPDLSLLSQNQDIIQSSNQNTIPVNPIISINFQDIFEAIFISGMLILLCKLIVQIISVFSILKRSNRIKINGINIQNLKENVSPFSFFNLIFINTNQHSESDLSEIIAHENIHATQGHSFDVMLVELFCVMFWVNPFAWILRKFLKQNLEFLTDKTVLQSGFEVKNYQYNLLKINGLNISSVTNSFNLSDLKMRIMMMNRKRTSNLHLVKYFILIPIGAVIILAFNITKAKSFDAQKSVFQNLKETVKAVEFVVSSSPKKQIEEKDNFGEDTFGELKNEIVSDSIDVKKQNQSKYQMVSVDFKIIDSKTEKPLEGVQILDREKNILGKTNFQGIGFVDYPMFVPSLQDERYVNKDCGCVSVLFKYKDFPIYEAILTHSSKSFTFIFENGRYSKNILDSSDSTLTNINEKPKDKRRSLYYLRSSGKPFIDPDIKLFYCKEDIIKELKHTQELSPDKRPVYLINTKQVPENYNFDEVRVNSIFIVQYWKPEYSAQIGQEYGKQCENGMYNLMLLKKDEEAYKKYKGSTIDKPFFSNIYKVEKCTPSQDFPPNALYVIDGKEVDSGYLHKNVPVEDIDKLEVMDVEIAKTKYGDKGKKGVILISTKKINKLH